MVYTIALHGKTYFLEPRPATRGWATGQLPTEIFKIMFSCYVQHRLTIILPLPNISGWLWPCLSLLCIAGSDIRFIVNRGALLQIVHLQKMIGIMQQNNKNAVKYIYICLYK